LIEDNINIFKDIKSRRNRKVVAMLGVLKFQHVFLAIKSEKSEEKALPVEEK